MNERCIWPGCQARTDAVSCTVWTSLHVGVVLRKFHREGSDFDWFRYTGTAVLRSGLKNGIFTIFAVTLCRIASMVISICSLLPIWECAVSTLARAIIFFNTGDHVVVVALPTCLSSA